MHKKGARGFSMIELMIVVVIVGILAAVAYPSYQNYIMKGNRSAAQGFMMQIASREEQYLLDARSYTTSLSTLGLAQPTETTGKYTFAISSVSPTDSYTVTATAVGGQASDGNLTLSSDGTKTPADKWQ